MYKLIIEDEEGRTTIVPLVKDEITIGRKEGNTVRLTERNVSRHHARLIKYNGSVFIEDLDSYNGVKVNGDRIEARTNLQEGDLIEIGDYNFALQWVEDDPPWKAPGPPRSTSTRKEMVDQEDRTTAVLKVPVEDVRKCTDRVGAVAGELEEDKVGRLVVMGLEQEGADFKLLRGEMVIGSDRGCDIVLSHASVSGRQAKVIHNGNAYLIVELDEARPVMVNGQHYTRVELRSGDLIELGEYKLRYLKPGEVVSPKPEKSVTGDTATKKVKLPAKADVEPKRKRSWISFATVTLLVLAIFGTYWIYRLYHATRVWDRQTQEADTAARPTTNDAKLDEERQDTGMEDFHRGVARMKAGDFDGAVASLRAALIKNPRHTEADSLLAKALREQKARRSLVEIQKAAADGQYDLAWGLLSSIPADSPVAEEIGKLRLDLEEQYKAFHLQKASRAKESGDFDQAIQHVDLVLGLDEESAFAMHLKKSILRLQRKKARGKTNHKKSSNAHAGRRNRKKEIAKLMTSALHAFQQEQYKESISILKEVIWLDPRNCPALKNIATSYVRSNQIGDAVMYYQRFVDACPRHKSAPQVRLFLKQYQDEQGEAPD